MKKILLITKFFPPETGGIQSYLYNLFLHLPKEKISVFCHSEVAAATEESPTNAGSRIRERSFPRHNQNYVRGQDDRKKTPRDDGKETLRDDVAFAPPFKIYRTDFKSPWRFLHLTTLALFRKLKPILRIEKPEYILCGHLPIAGPLAFMVKKFYNLPYAIFTYGMEISGIKKLNFAKQKMFLQVLREADKIITITDYMADLLAREFGLDRKKMVKIPPGAVCHFEVAAATEESPANVGFPRHNQNYARGQDDRKKTPQDDKKATPRDDGKKTPQDHKKQTPQNDRKKTPRNDKKILLTISRLVARKNHATVIRALREIIKEIPNLEYQIAGTGPEEKNLRDLVARFKLEKYVRFLGYVPDNKLPELYANADVFIMPSYDDPKTGDIEGFGIVFLEAAASGIPAIAGKSGGQGEAVLNGETGLLVEPLDVSSVSAAALRLLKDPDLTQKMGAAGCARVAHEFSWETQAKKLEKFFV